jgi:hypothetical protein
MKTENEYSERDFKLIRLFLLELVKYRNNPKLKCNHKNEISAQAYGIAHRVFPIEKLGYY